MSGRKKVCIVGCGRWWVESFVGLLVLASSGILASADTGLIWYTGLSWYWLHLVLASSGTGVRADVADDWLSRS